MSKKAKLFAIFLMITFVFSVFISQKKTVKFFDITFVLPEGFESDAEMDWLISDPDKTDLYMIKDRSVFLEWIYNEKEPTKTIEEFVETGSMLNSHDTHYHEISKSYTTIADTKAGIVEYYQDQFISLRKPMDRYIVYDVSFYKDGLYEVKFTMSPDNLTTEFDEKMKKTIANFIKNIQ